MHLRRSEVQHMQQSTALAVAAPRDPLTWGTDDVAHALGITPSAFRARRVALEAQGFPRRLPALRARWSIEAVRAWIALAGTEA